MIKLSPGNYTIDSPTGSVCVIDNVRNFQLTSASDIATVTCQSRSVGATTGGILFFKGVDISISNIIFCNCGGITTNITIIDNLGSFNNKLTVALMYKGSRNVDLRGVSLLNYNGFGVLAVDVNGSIVLQSVSVSNPNNQIFNQNTELNCY